ncbi:MAG TPA: hypothetical protein VIE43_01810 [Thermoanaerobaculia bacterium]|jgi:hypothetical protein|nr:hypothetical protein [Thermoanaerobaculia bacterium]
MSRKLSSVVAVLAFLSLSLAGAAEARPLAAPAAESVGLLHQIMRWADAGLSSLLDKDGVAIDPNGAKHQVVRRAGGEPGKARGEEK